ncbi:(deoxy)nucleoside triphosphate pyrophosphohydrolase [Salidesulfovibrio onnuriiensis]|uniref:(deoxy)nucleoside triphosphate pyrophosphohydrolase n=1 Tax=Salidesulfovibrio onnuriiensis TaxID=2583823 RepID=UPI0011CB4B1A|nr:(deoxy)nucleoside triphosphate pyrophosphohydrolase [Salidesulfovibrio onnuriiensis]
MVTVTAAVLELDGKILIARRTDKYLGGLWEFPGGKLEPGEDPKQCLERELFEEFGVKTSVGSHVVTHVHEYEHVTVELISYWVKHLDGEFELRDHDQMEWVGPHEFEMYDMAPADVPTVEAILKERLHV